MKRPLLLALTASLGLAFAGVATAQSSPEPVATVTAAPGPMCLVTLDELRRISSLRFETIASGDRNCSYDGANDSGPYTLDIRRQDADLAVVSMAYRDGGEETQVRGFPAWISDDGIWIDIGEDLLVVQPILFFADVDPPAKEIARSVADLALGRLGLQGPSSSVAPSASPTGAPSGPPTTGDVTARFPPDIAGRPLVVSTVSGADLLAGLDAQDSFRAQLLRDAIAAQGRSIDDLAAGSADIFLPETGDRATISALRLAGGRAAGLLDVIPAVLSSSMSVATNSVTIEGKAVVEMLEGGSADARYLYATDDVLWIVDAKGDLLLEVLRRLP